VGFRPGTGARRLRRPGRGERDRLDRLDRLDWLDWRCRLGRFAFRLDFAAAGRRPLRLRPVGGVADLLRQGHQFEEAFFKLPEPPAEDHPHQRRQQPAEQPARLHLRGHASEQGDHALDRFGDCWVLHSSRLARVTAAGQMK
jgi:hypothetical protein